MNLHTHGRNRFRLVAAGPALLLFCFSALAARAGGAQQSGAAQVKACIPHAAAFHGVNELVLTAIIKIESGFNPRAVNQNENGTADMGPGQINSIHHRDLARYGVTESHIKDPCWGVYIAAFHLANVVRKAGNTWQGIATYHSATPYFNYRYQVLVYNEMIRMGIYAGPALPVPPLRHTNPPSAPQKISLPPGRQDSAGAWPKQSEIIIVDATSASRGKAGPP